MPANTKQTRIAAQYAQALLDLGNERKQAEVIGQELGDLKQIIESNPEFAQLVEDPAIGEAQRMSVLERVFKGRVSELVMNTMGVLNGKGRLALLPQIAETYQDLLDAQQGKIEVDVTVASKLDPETLEDVRRRISKAFGKDAVVYQYVDESIIGGLIVHVDDKLIDASVRSQLAAMRQKLMEAARS